ncbi:23000_t:CDS:2 [Dentiscutata erythropus]|uniref:23000_t:CDS:1 n=1 Tax=Dentiscutata erythropus TaxID=1348616 RepID=A0A9N8YYD9_9GLOM|nr:23000_t:CDS:2 [Dentiscutata erythropus]
MNHPVTRPSTEIKNNLNSQHVQLIINDEAFSGFLIYERGNILSEDSIFIGMMTSIKGDSGGPAFSFSSLSSETLK